MIERWGSLTWLILEVEDGHDVIGEIKHWKHSHFGEDMGKLAQIQNGQHLHIACLIIVLLYCCCYGYYLIQCAVWIREPPLPDTPTLHKAPRPR